MFRSPQRLGPLAAAVGSHDDFYQFKMSDRGVRRPLKRPSEDASLGPLHLCGTAAEPRKRRPSAGLVVASEQLRLAGVSSYVA